MPKSPPTYEDLAAQARQDWDAAQRRAAAALAETQAAIAKMPDVKDAPNVGDAPWSAPGITCVCGGQGFKVIRWVTVNGVRYRTQLQCMSCKKHRTWDFPEKHWIESQPFTLPDVRN